MPWRLQSQARRHLTMLWPLLLPPPERLPLLLHSRYNLFRAPSFLIFLLMSSDTTDDDCHMSVKIVHGSLNSGELLGCCKASCMRAAQAAGSASLQAAGLTSRGLRDDIGGSVDILRGRCGQGCGQRCNLRGGHWWGPSCTMKKEPLTQDS